MFNTNTNIIEYNATSKTIVLKTPGTYIFAFSFTLTGSGPGYSSVYGRSGKVGQAMNVSHFTQWFYSATPIATTVILPIMLVLTSQDVPYQIETGCENGSTAGNQSVASMSYVLGFTVQ